MAKTGPLPNYLARVALAAARTTSPARTPAAGPPRLPDLGRTGLLEAPTQDSADPARGAHPGAQGLPPAPDRAPVPPAGREPPPADGTSGPPDPARDVPGPRAEAPLQEVPQARPPARREVAETPGPPPAGGAGVEGVPTFRVPRALRPSASTPRRPAGTEDVVAAGSPVAARPLPPPAGQKLKPESEPASLPVTRAGDVGPPIVRSAHGAKTQGEDETARAPTTPAPADPAGVMTPRGEWSQPPPAAATSVSPVLAAPVPAIPGAPAVAPASAPVLVRAVAAASDLVRSPRSPTEPRRGSHRVRVSIGRLEVQVNNPPPAPPAARSAHPARAPADLLERRFLERFTLGS
jgi:hypothetical protein